MSEDLTDVQRAILLKLTRNDPATVTEIHQWWFRHLSRARVKSAVEWLVILGLVRIAGVGYRNASTYTVTDEGAAVFARPTSPETGSKQEGA